MNFELVQEKKISPNGLFYFDINEYIYNSNSNLCADSYVSLRH